MYENGNYVSKDLSKAFNWYKLSSENGFAPATYSIGEFYYYGLLDEKQNFDLAYKFFEKAAELNYGPALYSLGYMWEHGEGKSKNIETAITFYHKAAELEDVLATHTLAHIYWDINHELFNLDKAREYFIKAYELGDIEAPLDLARTYNFNMNFNDVNEAFNLSLENYKEKESIILSVSEKDEVSIEYVAKQIAKSYNYENMIGKPQEGKSTFYPKRTLKESELNVNKSIKSQFNLLRVVDNERYPAFFHLNDKKYVIKIYEEK